ncbi:aminopeptidase N [Cellvibrio zantedeschiae]|uniref:Aminopeptidase N n=1 Tax=Cellvibrio zantedeschiae TaxID=1237077 RepID=A0ABQ3ARN5_9GAMM|nr:aminopeptidase N [Cellvibrio zantedeschiae]GGY63593.1 aminopeptidase N [Cellvibrio zantedeschiae]
MKISPLFLCAFLIIVTAACNLTPSANKNLERKLEPYLEQTYAAQRKQQISDVNYQLHIELDEASTSFNGNINIDFTLAKNNKMPVTVDFDGGEVLSVELNGKSVQWKHEKWFITFAPELFAAGKNNLRISYSHPFATAGDGLHRYKDQQTGNVYLYSNFEPYNAHKMFPHFDQPDIKASYLLDVIAPKKWQVISATRETKIDSLGDKQHWSFPKTPIMSSYVFSLHAGNYAVWEDKAGDIPLRLFARQELAQFVNYKEWFLFTQQSFAFYNQYFNYPYPFVKYDQLAVPDFNSGAMENIGAVTFNEAYISRGQKTYLQRMRHGNVISHEMAHMWFGDLVTMDWWNGLWLNESFATYMATLQQANNSEFKNDAWDVFYADMKQWAYTTDQQVTTHAIELPVANTLVAFTNFDGITYGKGASVLKQLAVYVGEENFRLGVASYLKKYAYANTTLKNFMDEVAAPAKQNLSGWSQEWLYKAGLNTISVDFNCTAEDGQAKVKNLTILQTAPKANPELRSQRVQIGLYDLRNEKLVSSAVLPITYHGEKTKVRAAEGLNCPDFVYPNIADWGYVKVNLDSKSRHNLEQHIHEFDISLRKMLWQNLWDDVEDTKIPLTNYLAFAQKNIGAEPDFQLVGSILGKLQTAAYYFWLADQVGQDHKADLVALEKIAQQQLERAGEASNFQRVAFDAYVALLHTPAGLEVARDYLFNKDLPKGFVVDQDRRWALLRKLNQYQFKDYRELTAAEQQKDKTDVGQQMAVVSEVIRPDVAVKEKWFAELLSADTKYKFATQRLMMRAMFPASQLKLREGFEDRIVQAIPQVQSRNNERFLSGYAELVSPHACTSASVQRLTAIRDQYANTNPALEKVLATSVQEEQRCVDMIELMKKK